MTNAHTEPAKIHGSLQPSRGTKMLYLIKRRPETTREELIAHWFARHMPPVIASQRAAAAAGKIHAWRYIATLYDADASGQHPWDGVAALSFDITLPTQGVSHGEPPMDSFQEKAMPYRPWATREYVSIDGGDQLPIRPSSLGEPWPCTRTGFLKISFLVRGKSGVDYRAFHDHWRDVHVPNVSRVMRQVGGLRYVLNLSLEPEVAPYAGLAELWFRSVDDWRRYRSTIQPDGMERFVDDDGTLILRSVTEMVGIP